MIASHSSTLFYRTLRQKSIRFYSNRQTPFDGIAEEISFSKILRHNATYYSFTNFFAPTNIAIPAAIPTQATTCEIPILPSTR